MVAHIPANFSGENHLKYAMHVLFRRVWRERGCKFKCKKGHSNNG